MGNIVVIVSSTRGVVYVLLHSCTNCNVTASTGRWYGLQIACYQQVVTKISRAIIDVQISTFAIAL